MSLFIMIIVCPREESSREEDMVSCLASSGMVCLFYFKNGRVEQSGEVVVLPDYFFE